MIKPNPKSDINQIKGLIEEIESLDIQLATITELQTLFSKIMHGYTVVGYKIPAGFVLYRGIKYSEKPNSYTDLIYPPGNIAKSNRANYEGEQMFYASASKRPVFYELHLEPKEKLVISTWRSITPLLFNNIGYTNLNFERLQSTRPFLDFLNPNEDATNNFIADYLAKEFCQKISDNKEYLYKISSAIAKVHLQNVYDKKFSGIFYPTVQLNAEEENFAVLKDTIDNGLFECERVEFIQVIDKIQNKYQYKIIDIADSIEYGNILWRNLGHSWTVFDDSDDINFVDEKENIVAYNNEGDFINPD